MPRRKVEFVRGGIYHIYNRGAGRHSIFYDDENYLYLLRILKELLPDLELTLLAYCLMPNHYHWLVRQDGDQAAGKLAQYAFNRYVNSFNKRYNRTGTLFEDRFEAIPVDDDAYVRQLCLYIHANPVRHGMAISPGLWAYSNYLEWTGQRNGTLVDRNFVESWFGSGTAYANEVRSYLLGQIEIPEEIRALLANLP
jgi:putative transposase